MEWDLLVCTKLFQLLHSVFYVAVFLLEGYANLSALVQLNIIDCILCVEQSLRRIPSLRFIGFLHSGRCGFTVCILSNYK